MNKVIRMMDEKKALKVKRDEAWGRVFAETRGGRDVLVKTAEALDQQIDALLSEILRIAP